MGFYAEIKRGRVLAVTDQPTMPILPDPYTVVDVTGYDPLPQSNWTYDAPTRVFTPPPEDVESRPLVRVSCVIPGSDPPEESVDFFKISPSDFTNAGLPKAATKNKWRTLSGAAGADDQTAASLPNATDYGPFMLNVPHPRGGAVVVQYRLDSTGVLEMYTPTGWVSSIPFWSRESGRIDLTEAFSEHVRLVNANDDPVVLNVMLG